MVASKSKLRPIMAAVLAMPGLGLKETPEVCAQERATQTFVGVKYLDYEDWQKSGENRIGVHSPMVYVRAPLGQTTDVEASFVSDTVSGASPFFYDTLSGASGIGIRDRRQAADAKFTRYFESFSLGAGGVISDEDDYTSRTLLVEGKYWTSDKNTVFAAAVSGSNDDITSTLNPTIDESRRGWSALAGVTQILDPVSLMQANLTYAGGDGYFSDPYKTLDNRPESRDQYALLIRHNYFVESLESSLHSDYRYYRDSWGVKAHTVEFQYYQPLPYTFMLRPGIRYYSQSGADFFTNTFPPETAENFLTADQRLSDFGGWTWSMKLIKEFAEGWSVDLKYEFSTQKQDYKAGGADTLNLKPFYSQALYFGLNKTFK